MSTALPASCESAPPHRGELPPRGKQPPCRRLQRPPSRALTLTVLMAAFMIGPVSSSLAQTNTEGQARNFEYLRGKTASYRLNAYVDYRIATHIIRFVETGSEPAGADEAALRARRFMEDLPGADTDPEQAQRLLVRAFTVRHLNGYADLMWARFIERANRVPPVYVEYPYGTDAEEGPIELFFWTYLLRGSVAPIGDFVERHVAFTLSNEAVAEQIAYVQEANGRANQRVVAALRRAMEEQSDSVRGTPPAADFEKVAILLRYASASSHPSDFLRGAIDGQHGAGRWDSAFRRLLHWRF